MNEAALVDDAKDLLEDVVARLSKGSDRQRVVRDLSRRLGVSHSKLWGLLYRPPKEVGAALYLKLKTAHADICGDENQRRQKFDEDLRRTREAAGADTLLIRLAVALAGETEATQKKEIGG